MALEKLAGDCDDLKTCPGIFVDEEGGVRVQGPENSDGLHLGADETGVYISAALILEAAAKLRERGHDR